MKKGYVFSNSKIILKSIEEFLAVISDMTLETSMRLSMGTELVVTNRADIVFLSDEYTQPEIQFFLDDFEKTQAFEKTSIVLVQFEQNDTVMKWLMDEKRIDFWIPFSCTVEERKVIINKAIERKSNKILLFKSQVQNEYLQSVLSNYERKNRYQQKVNEDKHILQLTQWVQTIRMHLNEIEEAVSLLITKEQDERTSQESLRAYTDHVEKIKQFLEKENEFLEERKTRQMSIKIATISQIVSSIQQKISLDAKQKGVVLDVKVENPKQSIVGRGADFMFVIGAIISDFIKMLQPETTLYLMIQSMESALLVKFSLEVSGDSLSQEKMLETFGKNNISRSMLDSIGAQFEFYSSKTKRGVTFYLPRLG